MAESVNISEIASKVSDEIFSFFKWKYKAVGPADTNFNCVNLEDHSSLKKDSDEYKSHTHPTDAVFHYVDPYLHKNIYLNTDLKSYGNTSISLTNVRNAINSLAKSIYCARQSEQWHTRFMVDSPKDIRGLLFVYNHDEEYEKDFYAHFNIYEDYSEPDTKAEKGRKISVSSLKLAEGQKIHIVDPHLIGYLQTVVTDAKLQIADKKLAEHYFFFYPQLVNHRHHANKFENPAIIELLAGPFIIIGYDEILGFNPSTNQINRLAGKGYFIYYRDKGTTYQEFMYLLDLLDKFQLIEENVPIHIRFANKSTYEDAISNFEKAKNIFQELMWGKKTSVFDLIQASFCTTFHYKFSSEQIGWERKK